MDLAANFTSEERLLLPRMARDFYGYGDFSRPYWFVGTEPGGGSLEELRRKLHAWQRLECNEVVCNRKHHALAQISQWHVNNPKPQSTWRPLLLAFMAYKGLYRGDVTALRWIKDQQATRFGCDGSDTTLLELGGLPAADRGHWPYGVFGDASLASREIYVSTYFPARVERIADEARDREPHFVWMYGSRRDYMIYRKRIAGGRFEIDPDLHYDYRVQNGTLFVVTDHTTHHRKNTYWIALGKSLNGRVHGLGRNGDRAAE
jgi:hypothetical protein